MMGLPHEDAASIEKTIALAKRLRPDWSVVSLCHPFPGTRLHDLCRDNDWLLPRQTASYYDPVTVIRSPWINEEALLEYFQTFVSRVYNRPTRNHS